MSIFSRLLRYCKSKRNTSISLSSNLFKLLPNDFTLLDLGAAGGIEPRWQKVSKFINYIALEPDSRSNSNLTDRICRNHNILDLFAWSESAPVKFNLCRDPQVSSAYTPNKQFLAQYQNSSRFDVVGLQEVEGVSLDSMLNDTLVDFIKLDVQGGELNALLGLEIALNRCIGLEIEVEFSDLYLLQPMFGDIHSFLITKGFSFFDFTSLCKWERSQYNGFGRCVFGDGLWLKNLDSFEPNDTNSYLKYIVICALYGKLDEAMFALEKISDNIPHMFVDLLKAQMKLQNRERNIFNLLNQCFNLLVPNSKLYFFN